MKNFWQKLKKPFFVLAPMENVTDFVFREIVAEELPKPAVFFTEFTNVESLMSAGYPHTVQRLKFSEKQRPAVAQIWGNQPENFYKAARLITGLGFDGIDINMGCPDKAVFRMGTCSALINNRPLAGEIISAVKKGADNLPVSVKTRTGINKVITEEWAGFLLNQKIDALTIHGRTVEQMSKAPADWTEIGKAVRLRDKMFPGILIIGNGDIRSYAEGLDKYKQSGVDGVMIGRGMLHNPWIFEPGNKIHRSDEYKKVLVRHLKLFRKTYGNDKNFNVMKKFFKMYINNFQGANALRIKLIETNNYDQVFKLLREN